MLKNIDNTEQIYTVSDLQKVFQIGRDSAYTLMHTVGFRVSKKSMRVRHSVLFQYLEKEAC